MAEDKKPVILWFRRDLRLDDNHALHEAVETDRPVICVYIREPEQPDIGPLGGAQAWWLHHSLMGLRESLKAHGNDLCLRTGSAEDVLQDIARTSGAECVFVNRAYERTSVDREIALALKAAGIGIKAFHGQLLHDPKTIRTGSGNAFKVYTPFWNAMQKLGEPGEPTDAPETIAAPDTHPHSELLDGWNLLPTKPNWATGFSEFWTPGEAGAQEKLEDLIDADLHDYKQGRDFPGTDATSKLSPHLALGEISPARIWHATNGLAQRHKDDLVHFRKELAWRDFCYNLLIEFPELRTKNWDDKFDAFEWEFDAKDFAAWTKGLTGYPIVDAGMRELWQTGYMHNRVRMITASFLIKDLLIDWRRGEEWFRDTLLDADPASNTANWQWVAGSGADASPFFRIFNPILQGEKFDPGGDYVRHWVPELEKLPKKYMHKPFEAPAHVLADAGVELGKTYPKPVVNHGMARDRALATYKGLKS
ncbi:deoxyribodipyrimidine photo-lyase [Rhizobiales bacterium RZME27]|uniref:Deoxyribodipyrimidine photo-lyase n=1 Tax=Endobacterium cereale TaxID=2663029 RepID=A0A6A8A490_9HYPH|nr:deoxyribodipyrimidine photo-lyase [Endobacterium cereale]MEB2843491.1 deoxyribodipyrimidine photo-lyase [Endobacterium cereale]MQY44607.1 deoxyribodipyrimidine photo-lyase [Endobacterium cereale]